MMLDGVVVAWAVSGPELDLPAVRDAIVSLLAAALAKLGNGCLARGRLGDAGANRSDFAVHD